MTIQLKVSSSKVLPGAGDSSSVGCSEENFAAD